MLSVINMYINRDSGVEERGADTGFRAGERRGFGIDMIVGANDVCVVLFASLPENKIA